MRDLKHMTARRSNLGGYNKRMGRRLELAVAEALEILLAWLNLPDVIVVTQSDGASYDIELVRGGRRAFVEVKGSRKYDRLIRRVNEAFRREHPEPFCVVGVLGFPRRGEALLNWWDAWIWTGPGRGGRLGRLGPKAFKRWLRRAGIA